MDQFLDSHPEVAEQLRKDPSLINDRAWVAQHPECRDFLQDHPQLAQAFRSDPNGFMHAEGRYDRRDDRDHISRRDLAEMDRFLDNHKEIAEQLRKDPSLIDNQRWVSEHPALQDYLRDHPQLAQAFRSDPNAFMHDEDRYDRRDDDITRRDVVEMDRFLDKHPEITEQLRKDPSLIDNHKWVAGHPALQDYLQDHPQLAQSFRSDPNAFMRDEDRYDQHSDNFRGNRFDADERNRGELTSFGQFLGTHSSMAAELSANPSLANNKEYLETHGELNDYLKAHPTMSQQLAQNPEGVMGSSWVQQNGGFAVKPASPKPKSNPNQ